MCDKTNLYANTSIGYRDFRLFMAGSDVFNSGVTEPTPDTFYNRILYAQAMHESGNHHSNVWNQTKNQFGMRPALSRQKHYCWVLTTSQGDYAGYDNIYQGIKDRLALDIANGVNTNLQGADVLGYVTTIQENGYAEDPSYIPLLMNRYREFFPNDDASYENYGSQGSYGGDTFEDGQNSSYKPTTLVTTIIMALVSYFAFIFLKKKVKK